MARHVQRLDINSFRGIRELSLEDLSDINIVVGENNSGKTSVLEALLLLSRPSDFSNVINVSRIRERSQVFTRQSLTFYDSFIYMFDRASEAMRMGISGQIHNREVNFEICGKVENLLIDIEEIIGESPRYMEDLIKEQYATQGEEIEGFTGELSYYIESDKPGLREKAGTEPISYHKYIRRTSMNRGTPIIKMKFISPVDHISDNIFTAIVKDTEITNEVVEVLKIFDENITNLKIVQEDKHRFVQTLDHKLLGNMPLSVYGDGIKKVLALANGIVGAKDGILLIDEIETSIHKSAMRKVFSWLVEASSKFNVQLFLTTHSEEVIDEILYSNPAIVEKDMARVITLVREFDKSVARILSGEKAIQVREDYSMELRQ